MARNESPIAVEESSPETLWLEQNNPTEDQLRVIAFGPTNSVKALKREIERKHKGKIRVSINGLREAAHQQLMSLYDHYRAETVAEFGLDEGISEEEKALHETTRARRKKINLRGAPKKMDLVESPELSRLARTINRSFGLDKFDESKSIGGHATVERVILAIYKKNPKAKLFDVIATLSEGGFIPHEHQEWIVLDTLAATINDEQLLLLSQSTDACRTFAMDVYKASKGSLALNPEKILPHARVLVLNRMKR